MRDQRTGQHGARVRWRKDRKASRRGWVANPSAVKNNSWCPCPRRAMSTVTADRMLGLHDWRDQFELEQYEELQEAMAMVEAEWQEDLDWYDDYLEKLYYDPYLDDYDPYLHDDHEVEDYLGRTYNW